MTESITAGSQQAGALPLLQTLRARAHWRQIDFISDLHLHVADPATFAAWRHYLSNTSAQAVFVLGDLFEVWVGDDVLSSPDPATPDSAFASACVQALRRVGERLDLFFLCGNRDFLVGPLCLRASATQGLDDPCALELGSARWLLSHGDALCLDDVAYQQFRALVRSEAWQREFLAQALSRRQATARQMRLQSEQLKRSHPVLVDVDTEATLAWMHEADASVLIHGHTHQPADHALAGGRRRIVLSDWDLQVTPPRAQVLRLTLDATGEPLGWRRLSPADAG